jgi:transcriptional regulator with XRE-family HTH domain
MPKPKTTRTIADYLADTGKTQADLADLVGVSEGMMSLILRGFRQPSLDVALRIEKETGVPVEAFARRSA